MFIDIQMEHTVASSSTATSPNTFYHVFINHRGSDVKETFGSHLYHRLSSAHSGCGLRVLLDRPALRVGHDLESQIKDAIRTATVHVAIFSPGYAESELCLNELLYMLDSGALIIPVFYHVEPAVVGLRKGGVYAEALRILEDKKTNDPQTHEEKPRHDPATVKKWREALSNVSGRSGLDLEAPPFNGDEGALVEKIIQRVLEEIKSNRGFYCSGLYGGPGGTYCDDGTYTGIKRITMTAKDNSLTSVQLYYGHEKLKERFLPGNQRGSEVGDLIEYILNYPEEIVTKISGYISTSHAMITSLTFHTNQRNLGPCGQEMGTYFETEMGGKIVGLFGRSGHLVDSIGVYFLKPGFPSSAKNGKFYCSQLYGGSGGSYRTDGTYSGIRRIVITANQNSLTSLQLYYGLEGHENYFPGWQHGGVAGIPHFGELGDRIEYNLNYPEEILTKISGHFGCYKAWPESWVVIKSLTFHTNKGKYGPCGQEQGTYFEIEEVGKIVGVFAHSGTLVDSIGVYVVKP